MITLGISCLTTFNLSWFQGLTFQVPTQYCSLQNQSFLSPPYTFRTGVFPLWLSLFIPSGTVYPHFSSSILDTSWPGVFIFQCYIFSFSFCSWCSQGKNAELGCHSLLQWSTFLSVLSTMTFPSWMALHDVMTQSFIEVGTVMGLVISLVSFLWLWFSFCLLSDRWG